MARTIIALLLLVSCSSETATFAVDGPESGGEEASTVDPEATGGAFVAPGTGVAAQATGGAPKATGGAAAATGGRSTGGVTATGGVTVTPATGGAVATGGAASTECHFIANLVTGPTDYGLCSVYTQGRFHCDAAGQCNQCDPQYNYLDCDGDGSCETPASVANCGGCGKKCLTGTCGLKLSTMACISSS